MFGHDMFVRDCGTERLDSKCEEIELYGRLEVVASSHESVVLYCRRSERIWNCLRLSEIFR